VQSIPGLGCGLLRNLDDGEIQTKSTLAAGLTSTVDSKAGDKQDDRMKDQLEDLDPADSGYLSITHGNLGTHGLLIRNTTQLSRAPNLTQDTDVQRTTHLGTCLNRVD
jgi:hypothetical protein